MPVTGRLLPWILRALVLASPIGLLLPIAPAGGVAGQATEPIVFSGSAAGTVVNVKVINPGGGGTVVDEPINGGGPTAQVSADSLGSTSGYAAFPDPGELVVVLPGLLTGLLAGGLADLPPIELPTLPEYPFYVSTDASNPEASAGGGPYELRARSGTEETTAAALFGPEASAAGSAGRATAEARIARSSSEVVSTATTRLEGLTIGPLTIGAVTSTATQTLDTHGTVTPTSSIEIEGVRIAGLAVTVSTEGLDVGGTPIPLPIGNATDNVLQVANQLREADITVELMPAETHEDRVVAPALRVTMPFDVPDELGGGGDQARLELTIGAATASLTGSTPVSAGGGAESGAEVVPEPGPTGGDPVDAPGPGPTGEGPDEFGVGSSPSGSPPASRPDSNPSVALDDGSLSAPPGAASSFDLRSAYLTLWACALAGWIISQLIRALGVRRPWSSVSGSTISATARSRSA